MKNYLLLFALFFVLESNGQLFEKSYPVPSTSQVYLPQIASGTNITYLFFFTGSPKEYIMALDNSGDTLWTRRFEIDSIASTIMYANSTVIANDELQITGLYYGNFGWPHVFCFRYNTQGNLINNYKQAFYNPTNRLESFSSITGESVFLNNYDSTIVSQFSMFDTTYLKTVIQKRASNGALLWGTTIEEDSIYLNWTNPSKGCFTESAFSETGEIYVKRISDFRPSENRKLRKYDANGILQYSLDAVALACGNCNGVVYTIVPKIDSTVYVSVLASTNANMNYILHLSNTGSLIDSLAIQSNGSGQQIVFGNIIEKGSNKYLLQYWDTTWASAGFLEFDSNLNYVSSSIQPFSYDFFFSGLNLKKNSFGGIKGVTKLNQAGTILSYFNTDSLYNTYPHKFNSQVLLDLNSNCSVDAGDMPRAGISSILTNSLGQNFYGVTAQSGNSTIKVPSDTYTLTHLPGKYKAVLCPSPSLITSFSGTAQITTVNIFDTIVPNMTDMKVQLSVDPYFYNTANFAWVFYENEGSVAATATLSIIKDSTVSYSVGNCQPLSVNGDTIKFLLSNIPPGGAGAISGFFPPPTSMQVGTNIKFYATIQTSATDADLSNNIDSVPNIYFGQMRLSAAAPNTVYRSNNITVNKPTTIYGSETLLYKINFQNNTGSTAKDLLIIDSLSKYLDLSTLKILGCSHPYELEVKKEGVLRITCKNINLADSSANSTASAGWFVYTVVPKTTWPIGKTIKNEARVYFDRNTPRTTNTTSNKKVENPNPTSIIKVQYSETPRIYPNPASTEISILQSGTYTNYTISNLEGQILKAGQLQKDSTILQVNELSKGIYVLECKGNTSVHREKLLVE